MRRGKKMTYQKKIDAEYQAEIDAFIANNGVKQLSNTDNQLGDTPSYRANRKSAIDAIMRKEKGYKYHVIKDALMTGEIVRSKDHSNYIYYLISRMRKAGWEIESIKGVGYKLIKVGGYAG